ncbi:MAG: hypothetical protein ACXWOH_14040 [Bdellovibrionota bacterium]
MILNSVHFFPEAGEDSEVVVECRSQQEELQVPVFAAYAKSKLVLRLKQIN